MSSRTSAQAPPPLSRIPAEKFAIADWLLRQVRRACPGQATIRGVEVGVKKGELASLLLRDEARLELLLVDRWAPAPRESAYARSGDPAANAPLDEHLAWYAETAERLRQISAGERARVMWAESHDAAACVRENRLAGAGFDVVFLDADHSYAGRLADLQDWVPLVRSGGIVAGGLLVSAFGGDGASRALHDFCEASRWRPELIRGPAQTWAFVRP